MRKILHRIAAIAPLLFIVAVLGFEGYAILVDHMIDASRLPTRFGNSQAIINSLSNLEEDEKPFIFAVIGDIKSHGTFESLTEKVLTQKPNFIVLLGDMVMKPSEREHNYFRLEISETISDTMPIFLIPGNHDVDREGFTMADFSDRYGTPFFTFTYRKTYMVFCPILPKLNEMTGTDKLEEFLKNRPLGANRTFVFLHIPPRLNDQYKVRRLETSDRIERLMEKYGVDTVFAGDYHGLYRIESGGVQYVITGGGGAHIKNPGKAGGFHHAVLVTAGPGWKSEQVIAIERAEEVDDRVEYLAGVRFYPILLDHPILASAANLVLLGAGFIVLRRLWRRRSHGASSATS